MGTTSPDVSPSNHEIISAIFKAVYSLTPGREAGSHTYIYALDRDRLVAAFRELVVEHHSPKTWRSVEAKVTVFAGSMAERFLLKVGKTDNFTMRLGGDRPVEIPRSTVSEVFGSIGYSLFPTWRKTWDDSTEAVRELPYFYFGEPERLFLPHIPDLVRRLIGGENVVFPDRDPGALFLIYSMERDQEYTLYDVMAKDDYTDVKVADNSAFRARMEDLRRAPLDSRTTEHLRAFFNAPVTVGVRDTLRWLNGARHPKMDWSEAREIIERCFERHRETDFLLPELNFYLPSPAVSPSQYKSSVESNDRFIELATDRFTDLLSPRERRFFDRDFVRGLLSEVFMYHHGYPQYHLEETMGYLSPGMLKVGVRFIQHLGLFLSGMRFPDRRNTDLLPFLRRSGWLAPIEDKLVGGHRRRFLAKLVEFILSYDLKGGLRSGGELHTYRRIDSTFYTFQERADYLPAGCRKLEQFSLESLAKSQYSYYLRRYPELAEKLVVFFTLVLRFFNDTDFIPDLRPDEAGINIFILGIWGYITENLVIILYEKPDGSHDFRIKFVDNKDHFKQYRRELDRDKPLGMAKHALRIVEPVVVPAMLRAVGNFVQIVHENEKGYEGTRVDLRGLIDYGVAVAQEVIVKGLESSTANLQTFLADSFDDATKIAGRTISKVVPGSTEKEQRVV